MILRVLVVQARVLNLVQVKAAVVILHLKTVARSHLQNRAPLKKAIQSVNLQVRVLLNQLQLVQANLLRNLTQRR